MLVRGCAVNPHTRKRQIRISALSLQVDLAILLLGFLSIEQAASLLGGVLIEEECRAEFMASHQQYLNGPKPKRKTSETNPRVFVADSRGPTQ